MWSGFCSLISIFCLAYDIRVRICIFSMKLRWEVESILLYTMENEFSNSSIICPGMDEYDRISLIWDSISFAILEGLPEKNWLFKVLALLLRLSIVACISYVLNYIISVLQIPPLVIR